MSQAIVVYVFRVPHSCQVGALVSAFFHCHRPVAFTDATNATSAFCASEAVHRKVDLLRSEGPPLKHRLALRISVEARTCCWSGRYLWALLYSTSSKWHNTVSPIHRPGTSGLSGSTTCRTAGPAQVPKSGKAGDQSRPVLVKASIFNIASIVQGSSADVHGLVQNFSWCQHAAVLCFPDRPASCKAVILCAC